VEARDGACNVATDMEWDDNRFARRRLTRGTGVEDDRQRYYQTLFVDVSEPSSFYQGPGDKGKWILRVETDDAVLG
jgi:hypothetical protein